MSVAAQNPQFMEVETLYWSEVHSPINFSFEISNLKSPINDLLLSAPPSDSSDSSDPSYSSEPKIAY